MGFVKKLRTPGKWFEINEIVRNHGQTKQIINSNSGVQNSLSQMNAIIVQIAQDAGVTQLPGAANTTLQGNGFPVPKMVWFGTLAYDTTGQVGSQKYGKVHAKEFASLASTLRNQVYHILESIRLAADALNAPTGDAPNPGGQV